MRIATNDEIRNAFKDEDDIKKPYGTTDGYINSLRANLNFFGMDIYVDNENWID